MNSDLFRPQKLWSADQTHEMDPKNLSVGQKQPFQAPPLQSLNTQMLQIIVELNFGAFKAFQDFFKHQGWTAGGILTYLDPKILTLAQK